MINKLTLIILLLTSPAMAQVEQCEQECSGRFVGIDTQALCEQLCLIRHEIKDAREEEKRMNDLARWGYKQDDEIAALIATLSPEDQVRFFEYLKKVRMK